MLNKVLRILWGDIEPGELRKFGLLACAFFFIIGTYWLLRPLKESIFFHTVGGYWQPLVKQFTIVFVFFLVMLYGKLIDMCHRHTLFYIIGATYAVIFAIIWYALGIPSVGFENPTLSPWRLIGWVSYISIESFGYLMAAHFWAFAASSTTTDGAKKGYPVIVTWAQVGAIIGSIMATYAPYFGIRSLLLVAIVSICCLVYVIAAFVRVIPRDQRSTELIEHRVEVKPKKTGFFEGIYLLFTRPYLLGIYIIVSLYEIVGTIVDLQMLKQAQMVPAYATPDGFAGFTGMFGICVNTVSFLFALVGTSYLMRRLGLVFCLLAFPVCLGLVIFVFWMFMTFSTLAASTLLWSLFGLFVFAKGLSYALNNPAKEMMYIPTSKDAKFKAKSWIDMFGARTAKAVGSGINAALLTHGHLFFIQGGSFVCLIAIGMWITGALYVGRTFVRLTKTGEIIE